jgi:hypothetical protein
MREIIQNNRETKKPGLLDPRLVNYVAQCRKMRITDEEIRRKLLKVGWPADESDRVLGKAKKEAGVTFLSPSVKPTFIENITSKEASEEDSKRELTKKKDPGFSSKKKILIIITLILFLAGALSAGYYFIFRKDNLVFQNKKTEKNKEGTIETDCGSKKFKKPKNTGSEVLRVDSTMKLLIDAISEGNYCMTMSLFSADSKDKNKDLIKKVIEDENKRTQFAQDLEDYMIPSIDENDPFSVARATVTSSGSGSKQIYSITFSKEETGEYLISSM